MGFSTKFCIFTFVTVKTLLGFIIEAVFRRTDLSFVKLANGVNNDRLFQYPTHNFRFNKVMVTNMTESKT